MLYFWFITEKLIKETEANIIVIAIVLLLLFFFRFHPCSRGIGLRELKVFSTGSWLNLKMKLDVNSHSMLQNWYVKFLSTFTQRKRKEGQTEQKWGKLRCQMSSPETRPPHVTNYKSIPFCQDVLHAFGLHFIEQCNCWSYGDLWKGFFDVL